MANASEILGDNEVIYKVFEGLPLKIYPDDDPIAAKIKLYIRRAFLQVYHFQRGYKAKEEIHHQKWQEWLKQGGKPHKCPESIRRSI